MIFFKIENYMLPCLNKKLLGFDCLGCGIQRSLAFIAKGDFLNAFKMYPSIYLFIFMGGFIILNLYFKFKNDEKIIKYTTIITLFVMVISYIFKIITI